jgi:pimeloyl-ACP methyl ester carboxylesterase
MSSQNIQIEQVMFRSGDVRCAADLYFPANTQQAGPVPGVVLGHSGGNVKEALADPARYLAEAGFAALAIDYRTYGASEGEPRGQLFPEKQVEDVRNGVSYLQTRPEVDVNRIGVWGVAIGASVAIQAALVDRRIKCVVAQTPDLLNGWRQILEGGGRERFGKMIAALEQDWQRRFETGESLRVPWPNFEDEVTQSYVNQAMEIYPTYRHEITLESFEHMLVWAPENLIEHLTPTPLLFVTTGGYDPYHTLDDVQIAYRRAGEPKRLEILPYDVVGLYLEPGLGEAMKLAISWFDRYLRKTPLPTRSPVAPMMGSGKGSQRE